MPSQATSKGSFSIDDGNCNENVSFKIISRFFNLCRVYSNLQKIASVGEEMYKKAWCTCKVVVLHNKAIAFLKSYLPSPSSLLRLPKFKGRGKGEFGRAREKGKELPRARSRVLIPFPFPFEHLPRRLGSLGTARSPLSRLATFTQVTPFRKERERI